MALDGAFLHGVLHEIKEVALGARVDKIAQPSREEIILHLRWRGGSSKLLISAAAGSPRIHFTKEAPENPKAPPMFCMLLRKHLGGAKLLDIRQQALDRICFLDFEAVNELGDLVTLTVAVEIMGRHSNIVLINQNGKVLDSIKRVDLETSSVRQVLPGMQYQLPPLQDKISLLDTTGEAAVERILTGREQELSKAVLENVMGLSPILCREAASFALKGQEDSNHSLSNLQKDRLVFFMNSLISTLASGNLTPTVVLEPEGRPRDFSFISITQYGPAMVTRPYPDCSSLLDDFYRQRDTMERMKQRSGDLLKLLVNTSERIARRIAAQEEELLRSESRETLREKGDLLSANLYALKKGDTKAVVEDFFKEESPMTEIELDICLTPVQNAQRYYALYRKADTAEKVLRQQIAHGREELAYVESVFDALTRCTTEAELTAIRQELSGQGYLRRSGEAKRQKVGKLPPLRYRSSEGYTILVGRNNLQNDQLTLKDSRNSDLWLHTQNIPGSHTIVVSGGDSIPPQTTMEAAALAAYHSKARDSSKVPVDYTLVRFVKKPSGAKPGKVIYDQYSTVFVTPDSQLHDQLVQE
ncbi:NFACT RNA binding domain-containing protein [Oscillospiraceae bacterium MB08-C2-2]|nr:NFACT RNA binding domain-containing protein [Oscillospiraceae bacterium MB08-C2-2]